MYFEPKGLRLVISGHAGMGLKGSDPICAGESMLFFTLLDWLYRREELMCPMVYMGQGHAELRCRPRGRRNVRRCRELMGAFVRGYELLAERFPQAVGCEVGAKSEG